MARTRLTLCFIFLAAGCGGVRGTQPPPSPAPPPSPPETPRTAANPSSALPVYTLDEVLADVFSSPLRHIGTGPWHGIQRSHACAYRNDQVIVVDVYCTIKEGTAIRIDVLSPSRGRARLYAEARDRISRVRRDDYFSFLGEAQPPPLRRERLPPLRLTMSLPELQAYERQRYEKFLPTCYGGVELEKPQGTCTGPLTPHARAWAQKNQPFLDRPPEDWYRLVEELRALAQQHGRDR